MATKRKSLPTPKIGKPMNAENVKFAEPERNSKYAPLITAIAEMEEGDALPFSPAEGETQENLLQRLGSLVSRACQEYAEPGFVFRVRPMEDGRVAVVYEEGKRRTRKAKSESKKAG